MYVYRNKNCSKHKPKRKLKSTVYINSFLTYTISQAIEYSMPLGFKFQLLPRAERCLVCGSLNAFMTVRCTEARRM